VRVGAVVTVTVAVGAEEGTALAITMAVGRIVGAAVGSRVEATLGTALSTIGAREGSSVTLLTGKNCCIDGSIVGAVDDVEVGMRLGPGEGLVVAVTMAVGATEVSVGFVLGKAEVGAELAVPIVIGAVVGAVLAITIAVGADEGTAVSGLRVGILMAKLGLTVVYLIGNPCLGVGAKVASALAIIMEGMAVGILRFVGASVRPKVGFTVGSCVGSKDGGRVVPTVGICVGLRVGGVLGICEGIETEILFGVTKLVGPEVEVETDGLKVEGNLVGRIVGLPVGTGPGVGIKGIGFSVGSGVGSGVGSDEGAGVGNFVGCDCIVGVDVGSADIKAVGDCDGCSEGVSVVGTTNAVGCSVGAVC
jgi:hypothetical protein